MPLGPGKYDAYCQRLIEKTGAAACVTIVIGGRKGSGFSVKIRSGVHAEGRPITPEVIADMLEYVAKDVRKDHQK